MGCAMTELYDEHLLFDSGIQHRRVNQLKANNHHPEYRETRVVESESSDHAYLLGKIDVLDVEFEDADASVDTVSLWVCSCPDFHFNQSEGIETGDIAPSEVGECKHIRDEIKSKRAKADESQASLGGAMGDD